ncbi:hypothetical protein BDZ94DRAFT_1223642 [Collybia nuda]|uniref:VHS domain-containing protein n=1 Tax=Collybia nuda TaxID=64659 RepID=A0A9P6CC13_9AGAR|nr:hypothetical protein BDZ94DRAFT_1223642 [Collybia nuda]
MSAFSFARQAFGREKPHSSITDWVDILTLSNIEEEAYDGIPELVDAINLQTAGPAEASRALRKKLKHGNPHQQYRALVLLKALVENCGHKFQSKFSYHFSTFADGQLTDALKQIASDSNADKRVKKKLLLVLASWRDQFKDDPSMTLIAGLFKQCRGEGRRLSSQELAHLAGLDYNNEDSRKKDEAKRKAKREKEEARDRLKREENEQRHRERNGRTNRAPFDFEKDKPKVLASIVDASQASSNLVNAITLVNPTTDNIQTNERVQECLSKAKQARKSVVRYIQLVENEEVIGTLIETNERIVSAIEMYDQLVVQSAVPTAVSTAATADLSATQINPPQGKLDNLQEQRRISIERVRGSDNAPNLHPDLQDLNFGPLGASSNHLPAPLQPSTLSDDGNGQDEVYEVRGSLSDFSDYDSSEEDSRKVVGYPGSGKRKGKNYVDVSDDPEDHGVAPNSRKAPESEADPFADPFADAGPSRQS